MQKFSVRIRKTVYSPVNIEVEAATFKEAAFLAYVKLKQDYPNWTDRINEHSIHDLEVRNVSNPQSKKRNLSLAGEDHILIL
jgi:hypothetical protein